MHILEKSDFWTRIFMSSRLGPCESVGLNVGTLALCLEGWHASAAKYEY